MGKTRILHGSFSRFIIGILVFGTTSARMLGEEPAPEVRSGVGMPPQNISRLGSRTIARLGDSLDSANESIDLIVEFNEEPLFMPSRTATRLHLKLRINRVLHNCAPILPLLVQQSMMRKCLRLPWSPRTIVSSSVRVCVFQSA
jgi:hypothetical protein